MKGLEKNINLRAVNNTSLPQFVSILNTIPNVNSANNNNILYEFNLIGQSFVGITNVNINISNTSNPNIVVNNAQVLSQNIQGVVDALNTLNKGLFSFVGTTIYVSSNFFIYSNLSIAGTSILGSTGSEPLSITIDTFGNIYTANVNGDNVTKITPNAVSTIFATTGVEPADITIDSFGNIYTANFNSNNVTKITPLGVSTIFATTGAKPRAITIDSVGNIYTANQVGQNITKITPLGVTSNYGNLLSQQIQQMVIDSLGNLFVVVTANKVIKIEPSGTSSFFGVFPLSSSTTSIAIDSSDNIYVSNDQTVWKLTPSEIQTVYGTTSDFQNKIAIDSLDNIYATLQNQTVEKILSTGGTLFISDLSGFTGNIFAILVDNFLNIYVTDEANDVVYLIVQ